MKADQTKAQAAAVDAEKHLKERQTAATKAKEAAAAAKATADAAAKKAVEAAQAAEKALADAKKTEETITASRSAEKSASEKIAATQKTLAGDEKEAAKSRQSLAELSATAVARQIEAEKSLIALGKLESFAQKVAPILAKRCLACHDAKTAKGRFNIETFASLMRGGESGPEIVAGKSAKSNLVTLIEDGTMPQDADPLTKSEIAVIRNWIDTGATLDAGLNPADPLIADMPSLPQPLPPNNYRVPIPVTAVAFSPDGDQLATSGYHEILVWNTADGTQLRRVTNVAERVYSLQYSPDGKLIAVGAGTPAQLGEVKLFTRPRATRSPTWPARATPCLPSPSARTASGWRRAGPIAPSAFTTWRPQAATGDRGSRRLGDGHRLAARRFQDRLRQPRQNGQSLRRPHRRFAHHVQWACRAGFRRRHRARTASPRSPADATNICGGGISPTAEEVQRIVGFGDEVLHVSVTKDGRIFSCSADRTARLHSLDGGKLLKTFSGHSDWVYALAFCAATNRLATGSFDGEIRVWNVADGKNLIKFVAAPGYKKPQLRTAALSKPKKAAAPAMARSTGKK